MTILYHHRTLLDGAEGIHIGEMIRAFERIGHRVIVCAPGGDGGRSGALPALARRALPQGAFECAAAVHNVAERRQALRLMDQHRPALVYARHALNDVGVLSAARRRGIPSVLEVNALYSSDALQPFEPLAFRSLARRLEARAFRTADLVVAVSSPLRDLVHEVEPSARAIVVPNGADPDQFSPGIEGNAVRRRYGLPPDALVVAWSGVVRSWHRLDLLVRALAEAPQAWLLVIGEGPDRLEAEQTAVACRVHDRVCFTGQVPRKEIAAHLAAADVGAVADDRTGYASPMKLLEYMAMGRAVIAPDLPNIRDLVGDGREALLFKPGDPSSLAACLARMADPLLRASLGSRGRQRIVTDRNWTAIARAVLGALAEAHPASREAQAVHARPIANGANR
jgi:glycosyltransferase involved in cell wall biosynthesis